jgi:biotin transporter BioY
MTFLLALGGYCILSYILNAAVMGIIFDKKWTNLDFKYALWAFLLSPISFPFFIGIFGKYMVEHNR